jgi:protein arginine N-methyltransferase 2
MIYKDRTLIFNNNKIYYTDEGGAECQVMMDWEDSIMKASADYVCENGGDILEIGFGMGISANHIQANDINSHTIIENHPQVIEKLKIWAQDKPNVIIVEGDWHDVKDSLSTYDGVFYDTYADENTSAFTTALLTWVKPKAKVSWWNNFTDKDDVFFVNGTTYEAISVNPVDNMYFNSNTYYLPKKQF